uniref:ENPP1-3/EXOG-like endonuclease/phosphodiesterase domain-containing protein n=1 Tax=Pelodiscus sinensis TaxID=13735 RepID=K7FR09_PELSI
MMLADMEKNPDMTTESKSNETDHELRLSQAIGEDYEDTSYDRGQLNPNDYYCDNDRTATFTLTNAVPMDPCFHQLLWSKLQQVLKTYLNENCIRPGGSPYLVTGAVASGSMQIPREDTDKEGDRNRAYNQVSVPSHIWTAVCCDQADDTQKFSVAFLAENKEESRLQILPVEELNAELARLYNASQPFKIFSDNCGTNTTKEQIVSSAVKSAWYTTFQTLLLDSYSQLFPPDERSRLDAETAQVMGNLNLDKDSVRLTGIEFAVTFPSVAHWYRKFKEIYDQGHLSCVLTPAAAAAKDPGTSDRVCTLQKQKHLPGSTVTAGGWSCVGEPCGQHNQTDYSWCYT